MPPAAFALPPQDALLVGSSAARRQRMLGPREMAFVRSWAEGVDVVTAWNRFLYVDGAGDARRARGELQRLRDQLAGLARIHGRPEVAALLRRDPEAMPDRAGHAPTLEQFADRQPPDYYSESELLELYQAEFGRIDARSAARRRQRLRARLLDALQWLDQVGIRRPQPTDTISAWLDERIAGRLSLAGLHTLADLHGWVRTKGYHWHRGIQRVGPQTAARLRQWLEDHAGTLGALPSAARIPPRQLDTAGETPAPRFALVPLERFVAPADRNGSQGSNRAPTGRCMIAASNDREAIERWLQLRRADSHTWRAYRKEAERFLLWSVLVRGKALSSLDTDDCAGFRDFLSAPGSEWCGRRGAPRWSEAWRPFEGGLSPRSQAAAVVIVRSLCDWLVRQRYLQSNPWHGVAPQRTARPVQELRAFSTREWSLVQQWLRDLASHSPSPALHRLRFLLDFGVLTGLRLAELASARLGWIVAVSLDGKEAHRETAWAIRVPGTRGTSRDVPLPDPALDALRSYLAHRGHLTDPMAMDPAAPLVSKLTGEAPLSGARIYDILAEAFERCAREVQAIDSGAADRIREASTHWLRHTFGAHAIAAGTPADVVQHALGHQSLGSVSIYLHRDTAAEDRSSTRTPCQDSVRGRPDRTGG